MSGGQSENLQVCRFGKKSLCQALSNDLIHADEVAEGLRVRYLLGYLRKLGAVTLVIENDYIDGDFLDDFAEFYVRCFAAYSKRCRRIHVLSSEFSEEQFLSILDGSAPEADQKNLLRAYLGFIVAKPLPDAILGRTALATYPKEKKDGVERHYGAVHEYTVNLFGLPLRVESLAYQEQDSVVAACATMALWCAFQQTASLFKTPTPSPAQITRSATQHHRKSRSIPSSGLSVEQMCHAVAVAGLEQELFDVRHMAEDKEPLPFCSLLYGYLKYGLPVIVGGLREGRGRHAITLTGFSIRPREAGKPKRTTELAPVEDGEPPAAMNLPGLRIESFYAHDDQIGPFASLEVEDNSINAGLGCHLRFERPDHDTDRPGWFLVPELVIVPIYHKVRITFLEAQKWFARLDRIFRQYSKRVSWDLFLATNHTVKGDLRADELLRGAPLRNALTSRMPRYLWKARLFVADQPAAEFLIDATEMAGSMPVKWFFWYDDQFRLNLAAHLIANPRSSAKFLTRTLYEYLSDATLEEGFYHRPDTRHDP